MATKVLQTIRAIEQANKKIGQNWFSEEAMRWFGTVIESAVYFTADKSFFVTSERDKNGEIWFGNKRYSIRVAYPDGVVKTWGEFGQFFTKEEAIFAIFDILRTES